MCFYSWKSSLTHSDSGCFSIMKDFGINRSFNGKICFSFFGQEYSGSPLWVVHWFQSEYSEQISPFHFSTSWFAVLIREFRQGIKHGQNYSYCSARLIRKCTIFLGYSNWSLSGRFCIMESTHIFRTLTELPQFLISCWAYLSTLF